MKTSSAKGKGRRLQQQVVKALIEELNISEDDLKSIPASVKGEDVWLSSKARETFPFSVECKNQESLNVWKSLKQAEKNCNGFIPILVFKRNFSETYCALKFEDFLSLVKQITENG